MARTTPTETFQPTASNSKRLAKLKTHRGQMSQTINKALDHYFNPKENPVKEVLSRWLVAINESSGSAKDFKLLCEFCGLDYRKVSQGELV